MLTGIVKKKKMKVCKKKNEKPLKVYDIGDIKKKCNLKKLIIIKCYLALKQCADCATQTALSNIS